MQTLWGFAMPLIIEAAVTHRVFDVLDSGPKDIDQVAEETGASVRGLASIMNALVGVNLLEKSRDGCYGLTEESAMFLVSTRPGFQGGIFRHVSRQLLPAWLNLTDVVKTGRSSLNVNRESDGSGFFHDFVADIFPMSHPSARAAAEILNVAAATGELSVLDLAAGSGVWGIAFAQASPEVRVTAVDWPGVLDVTRRMAERCGVSDRVQCVAGDLHDADFGEGHHIAILGHILHSEGRDRSRALLRKTAASLAPGGVIVIGEFLVNNERTGPPNGLIFAVNMLVATDLGDTFSFKEIAEWLREAGFTDERTVDAPGPSPLILARRAG